MKTGRLVRTLPPGLVLQIGTVIVAYAQLEHLLSSLIHATLGLVHQEGRLAVRQPRASERFALLGDLMALYSVTPKTDLDALHARIERCQRERDQLAHSVWLTNEAKTRLLLRLTRGSWQPVAGQRGKTKRISHPEGIQYGEKDAQALASYIYETNDLIIALGAEIEVPIPPSREKYRSRSVTRDRAPDRKPEGRRRPRLPD